MSGDPDVAIVGAGAAGIGAARRLRAAGRSVLLIEAGERIGGRAQTVVAEGMPLDLGCGWLHSADRNPWVGIAQGLAMAIDRTPTAWGVQWRDLGFPKADQAAAGAAFADFDRRLREAPPASDRAADALVPGGRWNAYLDALSGYINGTALARLSVADYLAYDGAASEVNWRVRDGYGALVAAAAGGIDVALATPVTAIDDRGAAVTIETARGTIRCGRAIVTVSTNVLASGAIRFARAIDAQRHAASLLPLGLADKLFLAVDGNAADLDADSHLIGDPHRAETGSYYLRPFGRPVIECFFGGAGARALEGAGAAATAAFAIDELAALLGGGWRGRLRPIAASAWGQEPRFGGSYSHAVPGHADARAVLATPPGDRLALAGEACSATDFSTAHGAYASGVAAAEAMLAGGAG